MAQLGSGFGTGYPFTIDTRQIFRNFGSAAVDSDTRVDAEVLNDVLTALVQIETILGANVQGSFASLAARLAALVIGIDGQTPTGLTNVVTFSVPMSVLIPGTAHKQEVPALLYQLYDTSTPRQAMEAGSLTVHPTTFDVLVTFAAAQSGTVMVAAPSPYYVGTFTTSGSPPSATILGTTHGLGQTYLFYQLYDTQTPAQAIQAGSFTVDPTTKNVTITFAAPQTGKLILAAGAPRYVQAFTSVTTVTITGATHGLGSVNLLWQIYDASAVPAAIQPMNVTVHPTTGDVVVSFALAQSGTVVLTAVPVVIPAPPPAPTLLAVTDYGAEGDGLTNDSPAIQATFDAAVAMGVSHVHFPPGSYMLGSVVTVTNASIQISGAGIEVTKLLVANSTGGLQFVSTLSNASAQAQGGAHHLWVHDLTLVAWGTGALNRGTALLGMWPGPSMVPATPHATLHNVGVRSKTYNSATASEPYFAVGIHLENAQDCRLTDLHLMQINNAVANMIHLDYAHDCAAFRATMRGLEIIGGGRGVYVTGWVENVQLSEFEIVGQNYAIQMDQSAATSDVGTPAVFIDHGHANGNIQTIILERWNDVHLSDLSLYTFPQAGTPTTDGIFLQDCSDVSIQGSRISVGPNQSATLMTLLHLLNAQRFTVTGNAFVLAHDVPATLVQGILVSIGSSKGVIQGNTFYVGGTVTNTRGILVQPNVPVLDQISVLGNRFENVDASIVAVDMANLLIEGNVSYGAGVPIVLLGTIGPQVIVRGNHPQGARLTMTANATTPSVAGAHDGLVIAQNTVATTITNFTGAYEGMRIEMYAANANTTVQHSGTIFLQGSTNVTLTTGSILSLRYNLGVWREVGRTLL